jgi:hypothetical protein
MPGCVSSAFDLTDRQAQQDEIAVATAIATKPG